MDMRFVRFYLPISPFARLSANKPRSRTKSHLRHLRHQDPRCRMERLLQATVFWAWIGMDRTFPPPAEGFAVDLVEARGDVNLALD